MALANFKGALKSESTFFPCSSELHFSEGGSTSYQAVLHETNQLDGETATESKEARGYRSHKFPRNSSNNLIKYLLEPWRANGRATTHLYSKHCSVLSLPGKWNHFQKCISHLISSFLLEWLCFAPSISSAHLQPPPLTVGYVFGTKEYQCEFRSAKQKTKNKKKGF